jgi:hypothetical protein
MNLEGRNIQQISEILSDEEVRTRLYSLLFEGRRKRWLSWGAQVAGLLKSFSA